jgi:hypothetical protein
VQLVLCGLLFVVQQVCCRMVSVDAVSRSGSKQEHAWPARQRCCGVCGEVTSSGMLQDCVFQASVCLKVGACRRACVQGVVVANDLLGWKGLS